MNKLQTIIFKNRPYLFFLFLPIPFIFFLLTAIIIFGILKMESLLLFAVIFLIEFNFLVSLFARMRYRSGSEFCFNKDYYEYNGVKSSWTEIRKLDFYYRGDRFWHSKFKLFQKRKANRRYSNLNYVAVEGYIEKLIDKIIIDSNPIYFKIRSTKEKQLFFQIKELAESNNVITTEMKTDFSYSLFGTSFGR
jgi:hypothetical protein